MNDKFKDITGRVINEGDYLVQAYSVGSSSGMRFAKVLVNRGTTLRCLSARSWGGGTMGNITSAGTDKSMIIDKELIPREAREVLDDV